MKPHDAIIAGMLLAGLALHLWPRETAAAEGDAGAAAPDLFSQAAATFSDYLSIIGAAMTPFALAVNLPGNRVYVDFIAEIEQSRGLPPGLLVRLAWQECRFRADIIEGRTVSSAGAKGMWQLMPIHWPYVDPLDWRASAGYAADMLVRLNRRFGTWALALAAYNWGEGNLAKKGIAAAPRETRDYYASILADIGQEVTLA